MLSFLLFKTQFDVSYGLLIFQSPIWHKIKGWKHLTYPPFLYFHFAPAWILIFPDLTISDNMTQFDLQKTNLQLTLKRPLLQKRSKINKVFLLSITRSFVATQLRKKRNVLFETRNLSLKMECRMTASKCPWQWLRWLQDKIEHRKTIKELYLRKLRSSILYFLKI